MSVEREAAAVWPFASSQSRKLLAVFVDQPSVIDGLKSHVQHCEPFGVKDLT